MKVGDSHLIIFALIQCPAHQGGHGTCIVSLMKKKGTSSKTRLSGKLQFKMEWLNELNNIYWLNKGLSSMRIEMCILNNMAQIESKWPDDKVLWWNDQAKTSSVVNCSIPVRQKNNIDYTFVTLWWSNIEFL